MIIILTQVFKLWRENYRKQMSRQREAVIQLIYVSTVGQS